MFDSCCPRGTYFIYTPTYSRIVKCRVCNPHHLPSGIIRAHAIKFLQHVAPGTFEWSTSRNGTEPRDGFILFLILMPSHPPVCFIQYSRTFVHAFPSLSLATNFHISSYHKRLRFSRGFKIQLCISSSEFSMLAYFPSTYLRLACERTQLPLRHFFRHFLPPAHDSFNLFSSRVFLPTVARDHANGPTNGPSRERPFWAHVIPKMVDPFA